MAYQLFSAALLASILSLDSLTVAFAYGCDKIKIPFLSACIINIICTATIGLAFVFGSVVSAFITPWFASLLSFFILLLIGITKLLDSITKSIIRKFSPINKEIKLSLLNFKFILKLYAYPESADLNSSRSIEPKEAVLLAIPISLDGFAVGFGAALLGYSGLAIVLFSLLTNGTALLFGSLLGNKTAQKIPFNVSWLAGVVLVGLAVFQLL